jgi:hypothetical protein
MLLLLRPLFSTVSWSPAWSCWSTSDPPHRDFRRKEGRDSFHEQTLWMRGVLWIISKMIMISGITAFISRGRQELVPFFLATDLLGLWTFLVQRISYTSSISVQFGERTSNIPNVEHLNTPDNKNKHSEAYWIHTSQETHQVSITEPNWLMLCGQTVAVWCVWSENRTEHTNTLWAVRTSQESHHVSTTEPNRLMLFGQTVAVCCENRTEHTDTLWAVRTSQETHHVSTTEPNRLMLCGETVAVCCENRTEHTDKLWAVRGTQIHCVDRMLGFSIVTCLVECRRC